jgi:aconitate hydratase
MAAPPASATAARCPPISKAIKLTTISSRASVLSGNRNFEGRVNPDVRANYLASPPLVVAYALAGSMNIDMTTEPLGIGNDGNEPVFLKDIWPTNAGDRRHRAVRASPPKMFAARYSDVFKGDENWQAIKVEGGETYGWTIGSTYVQNPPYFEG